MTSIEQDLELLRKDKRVKEVTYEDDIITIHTNNFRCVSPGGTREVYIGELQISFSFTRQFASKDMFGGIYNFNGHLDIKNLTEPRGSWQTPMVFRMGQEAGACWKGYMEAMDRALRSHDILTFTECLFRFCSSYDSTIPHGESFWEWSTI